MLQYSTPVLDYQYCTTIQPDYSIEMSRLTRDGTAEPVSRDQILRHARGQGNIIFPCSAGHEQDWSILCYM